MGQQPLFLTSGAIVCLLVIWSHFSSVILDDVAECSPRCWNPVQLNSRVLGATKQQGVGNEEECKALCFNNGTCIGVDWIRTSNQCWFQLDPYVATNVNHWSLANCTEECVPYCWKAVKDNFHADPGTLVAAADENHCKLKCSNTSSCNGVDWNSTSSSCWLINNAAKMEALNGIRHWDIIRNLPTSCQIRTGKVTSSTANISITSNTVTSVHEENTAGCSCNWKTGFIVLAVLLGLCILIIIGFVIYTIRNGRMLNTKSDAVNTEMEDNYEVGLQRADTNNRSVEALYTDLVKTDSNYDLQTNNR